MHSGGSYTLKVEAAGFRTLSKPLALDLVLETGPATETIEVAAPAEVLQTTSATLGNVAEQRAVVNLPLNGRSALNQCNGNTVNVNGARSSAVNATLDGIEANESTNPNPHQQYLAAASGQRAEVQGHEQQPGGGTGTGRFSRSETLHRLCYPDNQCSTSRSMLASIFSGWASVRPQSSGSAGWI
jgi:hypothetical protein